MFRRSEAEGPEKVQVGLTEKGTLSAQVLELVILNSDTRQFYMVLSVSRSVATSE